MYPPVTPTPAKSRSPAGRALREVVIAINEIARDVHAMRIAFKVEKKNLDSYAYYEWRALILSFILLDININATTSKKMQGYLY
jgi:hypothetical protein